MIKLVDLGAQHEELKDELAAVVSKTVAKSAFMGGAIVKNFELNFAEFNKSNFAIGTSNGTSALEVALRVNGVGAGDEVITVANTFFATAESIFNVGATPVFVDIDEVDGLIDISKIASAITSKTKAIIPVHLFGHLVDMPSIMEIARNHRLIVIEDAAQAHGSVAEWGTPGKLSQGACFSFYPGKNLGAWGDAGAIVTDDSHLAALYSKVRDHGRLSKYEHDVVGTNARLDGLQAGILDVKLSALPRWNSRRADIAEKYIQRFTSAGFKVLFDHKKYKSSWHLFVIRVANRDDIQRHFKEREIETGIHYPIPLHKQPALISSFGGQSLPITEKLSAEIISIPIHPHLTESQVEYIIETFLDIAIPQG